MGAFLNGVEKLFAFDPDKRPVGTRSALFEVARCASRISFLM